MLRTCCWVGFLPLNMLPMPNTCSKAPRSSSLHRIDPINFVFCILFATFVFPNSCSVVKTSKPYPYSICTLPRGVLAANTLAVMLGAVHILRKAMTSWIPCYAATSQHECSEVCRIAGYSLITSSPYVICGRLLTPMLSHSTPSAMSVVLSSNR